jgi:Tfp pilus assembly protein PilX
MVQYCQQWPVHRRVRSVQRETQMLGRSKPEPKADVFTEGSPMKSASAGATFRLIVSFMLAVILAFLTVEGWRTWRDYRSAFASARDSVTNLARATAQHAEDAIRQVDVLTTALAERVEGDGLQSLDAARIHKLLVQQSKMANGSSRTRRSHQTRRTTPTAIISSITARTPIVTCASAMWSEAGPPRT